MKTIEERFIGLFDTNLEELEAVKKENERLTKKYILNEIESEVELDHSIHDCRFFDNQLVLYSSTYYYDSRVIECLSKIIKKDCLVVDDALTESRDKNSELFNRILHNKSSYNNVVNIDKYIMIAKISYNGLSYLSKDLSCYKIDEYKFFNTEELAYTDQIDKVLNVLNKDGIKESINKYLENLK